MMHVQTRADIRAALAAVTVAAVYYAFAAYGAAAPTLTLLNPAPTIHSGPVVDLTAGEQVATVPDTEIGRQVTVMSVGDGTVFDAPAAAAPHCFVVPQYTCYRLRSVAAGWDASDAAAPLVYVYAASCLYQTPSFSTNAGAYYLRATEGGAPASAGGFVNALIQPQEFCSGSTETGISVSTTLQAEDPATATIRTQLVLERTR